MKDSINFDEALSVLATSEMLDDDCSFMGAVVFVSEVFGVSEESILQHLDDIKQKTVFIED